MSLLDEMPFTGFQASSISMLGDMIITLSKTDSPLAVRYWSRMAEIRATVFPDLLGPRKIPVHGTRGTIGSRAAVLTCTRWSGRASLFPFLPKRHIYGGRDLLAQPGRQGVQLLPGLARPVPAALPLGRFGVPAVLEGFAASALGTDWLAGNPRQVVPNAGGLLVAKAVHAVGHVVVRQRLHVGPTLQAARFAGSRRPTTEAGGTR